MRISSPNRSGREMIVLAILFVGAFAFLVNNYIMENRVAKAEQLASELLMLRTGYKAFTRIENRPPESLIELATTKYKLPGDERNQSFVERVSLNEKFEVVDPFWNPYIYNKVKGWIASSTAGYKSW